MFVTHMFADLWIGRRDDGAAVQSPTHADIDAAIRALNAADRTLVIIAREVGSDQHMVIGGGASGRCIVYATSDGADFQNLCDVSQPEGKVTVFVGGQDGDYDAWRLVPLEWALQAARAFAEHGRLDPELQWRSDA